MKIHVAKTAGFCMGVQRAVEMALEAANRHSPPIYTYGPLIHNPQVLSLLEEKGISVMKEIPESGSGTVLIRAHGVPPDVKVQLEQAGFSVIDATCPRVIKVQAIIEKHAAKGYACIIIGDENHPEVVGLLGMAGEKGIVAGKLDALENLPIFDKAIIVAQTTQNTRLFEAVKKWASRNHPHYKVFNTICDSTEQRQTEVKRLAGQVEAVVVVGGHESGNTQRLAEIVGDSGKPAYHIETEAELDVESLAFVKDIGITAGASTPNWIIRRVYRAIESLPFNNESPFKQGLFRLQRLLLLSNLYVALGAGALCYTCTRLQEIPKPIPYIVISILYVLSMHILNNLTGLKEARFNDPDRADFYDAYKIFLTLMALASGGMGLSIAASMGMFPFFLLLTMTLLGLCYNLKIIPEAVEGIKYRRIRDIPGSKTVLIALAWGVVTTLFPILSATGKISLTTLPAFAWAASLVFVRTGFFDILDMQGDQIVGKETLPILLGKKQSVALLRSVLLVIFVMLFLTSAFHIISSLGFFLLFTPVYMGIIISIQQRGHMLPGVRLEFITETLFILTGILTLGWALFH